MRGARSALLVVVGGIAALTCAPAAHAVFQFTKTDYAIPAGTPTDLELADIDGTAGTDVVMATFVNGGSPDSRIVRFLNGGGGAFGTGAATDSCDFGYDLLVHNFSPGSDSNPDALVNCGFLLGNGAGAVRCSRRPTTRRSSRTPWRWPS